MLCFIGFAKGYRSEPCQLWNCDYLITVEQFLQIIALIKFEKIFKGFSVTFLQLFVVFQYRNLQVNRTALSSFKGR